MNNEIKGFKMYLIIFLSVIFIFIFIVSCVITCAGTISDATRGVKVAAIVNGVEVYRGPLNRVKVEQVADKVNLTIYDSALNFNVVKNYLEEDISILTVVQNEN